MSNFSNSIYVDGDVQLEDRIISSLADGGLSPFSIASKVWNENLNSDYLDGYHAIAFPRKAEDATITGNWTYSFAPVITTPGTNANSVATYDQILSRPLTGYVVGSNAPITATDSVLTAFGKLQASVNAAGASISGTIGTLPVFSTTSTLGNSIASQVADGANTMLSVAGRIMTTQAASGSQARGLILANTVTDSRWIVGKLGMETGSDAGSDLVFWRFSDTNTFLGSALTISRATGNAVFAGTVSGATPTANAHLTTKLYVDNLLLGYVPNTRTLSINGTSYNLSADRSWTIPTGLSGSGTVGRILKYTAADTAGNSIMFENGSGDTAEVVTSGRSISDVAPSGSQARGFGMRAGGLSRWHIGKFGLETGSDSGSDLVFWRSSDAGTFLGTALTISRATGAATFSSTVTGATPTANAHLTTKLYVDTLLAGYVPNTRTITINGVGQNLSADRSWTIATGIGGGGTAGQLPKFTATDTIGNSIVNESSGIITIDGVLHVGLVANHKLRVTSSSTASYLNFMDASSVSQYLIESTAAKMSFMATGTEVFRINNATNDLTIIRPLKLPTTSPPFEITSTAWVENLNVDRLDNQHGSYYLDYNNLTNKPVIPVISGTAGRYIRFTTATSFGDGLVYDGNNGIIVDGQLTSDAAPNSNPRGLALRTETSSTRWWTGKAGLETGSNSGSDYALWRFDDAGSFIAAALTISRATGNAVFAGNVSAATPTVGGHLTTKTYVDNLVSGFIPSSRTLTINGTSYDLSADRSWTVSTGIGGSGLVGRLPVFTATNIIGTASDLYYDTTNNRLGIGVSTPLARLHINGTVMVEAAFVSNIGTGTAPIQVTSTTMSPNLNADMVDGMHASAFLTGITSSMVVAALGYTPVAGSRSITINGVTQDLFANRTWTISTGIGGSGLAGRMAYFTAASTIAHAAQVFYDDANSRLGVGISTPTARLHVNGSVLSEGQLLSNIATGTSPLSVVSTTVVTNLNADMLDGLHASSFLTGITSSMVTTALGYTPVAGSRTITINGVTQDLFANRTWTISAGVSGSGNAGRVAMFTGATSVGNATDLYYDSTNNRLGIGLSSPDHRLHVNGTIRAESQLQSGVATGTPPLSVASVTTVANLNADLLDGYHASAFATASHTHGSGDITNWTSGVRSQLSAGSGISYNSSTGVISATGGSGGGGAIDGSGTTGYIPKFTSSINIGNSDIQNIAGLVIIGTVSNQVNLSVQGTIKAKTFTVGDFPASGTAGEIIHGSGTGGFSALYVYHAVDGWKRLQYV